MVIVFIIVIVIGIFYFLIYLLLMYYVHLIDNKFHSIQGHFYPLMSTFKVLPRFMFHWVGMVGNLTTPM